MSSKIIKKQKIMDEIRDVMRLHHYSIHTERSHCDWIQRFIHFHNMKSRDELKGGEFKIRFDTVSPLTSFKESRISTQFKHC